MLEHRDELGVRVVAVGFARPEAMRGWARRVELPEDVLVLSDVQRRAYAAFGFGRGSVLRVWLDPRVWLRYARLLGRHRPERSTQDTLQLGGDVLADGDGVVRWIHRSRGPEDRPTLAAIRRAAGPGA